MTNLFHGINRIFSCNHWNVTYSHTYTQTYAHFKTHSNSKDFLYAYKELNEYLLLFLCVIVYNLKTIFWSLALALAYNNGSSNVETNGLTMYIACALVYHFYLS